MTSSNVVRGHATQPSSAPIVSIAESPVAQLRQLTPFRWAWMLVLALGVVDWAWASRAGMRFEGWGIFSLDVAFLAAVGLFYQISGRSLRLADAGQYLALWAVFSVVGCIFTYVAATVDMPLRDAQLARWDAIVGFDWYRWAPFVARHARLELLLDIVYSSILPQIIGSVIYFSHCRRRDRNDEFLWTMMLSAIVTTAVSGLVPAQGPGLKGQHIDWSMTLMAIRDGSESTFSLKSLQGIIAFPSYHTVTAILLIYAHRPPLISFRPVLILNLLMLLSVPSGGQHYLVDMASGAAVAASSIMMARWLLGTSASCVCLGCAGLEETDAEKQSPESPI